MKTPLIIHLIEFKQTLIAYVKSISFIRTHRIWDGFWRYGWVSRMLIFIAVIVGFKFFQLIKRTFASDEAGAEQSIAALGTMFKDFTVQGYDFLFTGFMKYLMLDAHISTSTRFY